MLPRLRFGFDLLDPIADLGGGFILLVIDGAPQFALKFPNLRLALAGLEQARRHLAFVLQSLVMVLSMGSRPSAKTS